MDRHTRAQIAIQHDPSALTLAAGCWRHVCRRTLVKAGWPIGKNPYRSEWVGQLRVSPHSHHLNYSNMAWTEVQSRSLLSGHRGDFDGIERLHLTQRVSYVGSLDNALCHEQNPKLASVVARPRSNGSGGCRRLLCDGCAPHARFFFNARQRLRFVGTRLCNYFPCLLWTGRAGQSGGRTRWRSIWTC